MESPHLLPLWPAALAAALDRAFWCAQASTSLLHAPTSAPLRTGCAAQLQPICMQHCKGAASLTLTSVGCRQGRQREQQPQQACSTAVASAASESAAKHPLCPDSMLQALEQAAGRTAACSTEDTVHATEDPHQWQAMQLLHCASAAAPTLSASGSAAAQLAMCALAVSHAPVSECRFVHHLSSCL